MSGFFESADKRYKMVCKTFLKPLHVHYGKISYKDLCLRFTQYFSAIFYGYKKFYREGIEKFYGCFTFYIPTNFRFYVTAAKMLFL